MPGPSSSKKTKKKIGGRRLAHVVIIPSPTDFGMYLFAMFWRDVALRLLVPNMPEAPSATQAVVLTKIV